MTKIGVARVVVASLAILVVLSGVYGELRYGAICSLQVGLLSVIDPVIGPVIQSLGEHRVPIYVACPLGFLERSLAVRAFLPEWSFSVVLLLISVILLGRVFCGWICPAGLLQRLLPGRGASNAGRDSAARQAGPIPAAARPLTAQVPGDEATPGSGRPVASKAARWAPYSSYAFLGGTLLASFVFQFPVFCFVCPIGLFFGAAYAVLRLASVDPLSLELVLFPAMLGVELWLFKKHWCRSICPLGAMLSIVGNLNRFLLPTVRKDTCLTSKGVDCHVCERACPEGIKLADIGSKYTPNSCTKCLACYEKCPKGAVEIAIVR